MFSPFNSQWNSRGGESAGHNKQPLFWPSTDRLLGVGNGLLHCWILMQTRMSPHWEHCRASPRTMSFPCSTHFPGLSLLGPSLADAARVGLWVDASVPLCYGQENGCRVPKYARLLTLRTGRAELQASLWTLGSYTPRKGHPRESSESLPPFLYSL